MNKQVRYSPEVRERAVRLVYENQGCDINRAAGHFI